MGSKRNSPYVWVTWLTKPLAGEESCQWKLWFKSNFQFTKRPSDFNLAKWSAEHTALTETRAKELRDNGYSVYIEDQNSFKLQGGNGAVLSGKADIVAVKDGDACVIDCKTGSEKHSDKLQVLLYMYVLPKTIARYRGLSLRGEVQYSDHITSIGVDEIDDRFKGLIRGKMNLAASVEEPEKAPSFGECRFCDIPVSECPERIDKDSEVVKTDIF